MIGSVLTQELQKIIVEDNNIQAKSNELLGADLYVYRNIDFHKIDTRDIKTPHCNIIFGGDTEGINSVDYSVYFGFSTILDSNIIEEKTTYNDTDIKLEKVMELIIKTLKKEFEIGIGDETGFEVLSTHIEPFSQQGQDDTAFILEMEIHQKKSC